MSHVHPSLGASPGGKAEFTQKQRQLLALLFIRAQTPQPVMPLPATLSLGGPSLELLQSLEAQGLAAEYQDGWALTPLAHDLMVFGALVERHGGKVLSHV